MAARRRVGRVGIVDVDWRTEADPREKSRADAGANCHRGRGIAHRVLLDCIGRFARIDRV